MMPKTYYINQYTIHSDVILPCTDVPTGNDNDRLLSIHIVKNKYGLLPPSPHGDVSFERASDGVLMGILGRTTIWVSNDGHRIEVESPGNHWQESALYLVGVVLALCTALHGDIPLHASSVQLNDKRIALMAPCGGGKSTTLWALLEAGALFANDDLVPTSIHEGVAFTRSAKSMFPKIGEQIKEHFNHNWADCSEILSGRGKFWFPIPQERRAADYGKLDALFLLDAREKSSVNNIDIARQKGIDCISIIAANSLVQPTLTESIGKGVLMSRFARLAATVPLYVITYPKRFEALPTLINRVEQVLDDEGK